MTIKQVSKNYKLIAEKFFSVLAENKFHATDIKYSSGYQKISEKGEIAEIDNVYITYHVKELKGWLFGLWLNYKYDDIESKTIYQYNWFTQVEKHIDKFKPAQSQYSDYDDLNIKDIDSFNFISFYGIFKTMKYIKRHKNLAWCRDVLWIDYNENYVSNFKAFWLRAKKTYKTWKEETIGNYITKKHLALAEKYVLPTLKGAYIYDNGENFSPRYTIEVKLSDLKEFGFEKAGTYALDYDDKEDAKYLKKAGKLENLEYRLLGWTTNFNQVRDSSFMVIDDEKKKDM